MATEISKSYISSLKLTDKTEFSSEETSLVLENMNKFTQDWVRKMYKTLLNLYGFFFLFKKFSMMMNFLKRCPRTQIFMDLTTILIKS
jgi:hypothetical protein